MKLKKKTVIDGAAPETSVTGPNRRSYAVFIKRIRIHAGLRRYNCACKHGFFLAIAKPVNSSAGILRVPVRSAFHFFLCRHFQITSEITGEVNRTGIINHQHFGNAPPGNTA